MSATFRSLAPFARTARFAFKKTGNPLVSLQQQSRSPVLNLRRGYAVYERTKPHVNIGKQTASFSSCPYLVLFFSQTVANNAYA